jgi:hypothetical protein
MVAVDGAVSTAIGAALGGGLGVHFFGADAALVTSIVGAVAGSMLGWLVAMPSAVFKPRRFPSTLQRMH